MSSFQYDPLGALLSLLSWGWPLAMGLPALAALIVASVCTRRRTQLGAAWLMAASWSAFALLVTVEVLLWKIHSLPYGEWRIWVDHGLNLLQLVCELGVLVALLLFRPGRGAASFDDPDGSYADDHAARVMP